MGEMTTLYVCTESKEAESRFPIIITHHSKLIPASALMKIEVFKFQ
jgi:hypothetical protein